MKSISLESTGRYLLRCPSKPVEEVDRFLELLVNIPSQDYKKFLSDSLTPLKRALFIASPDFVSFCESVVTKEDCNPEAEKKLVITLYKYLSRMATRCTPFGLFAGSALGQIDELTNISFSDNKQQIRSRLDMHYAAAMGEYLNSLPKLRENIKFSLNDTLYRAGDRFRYVEFQYSERKREYIISAIKGAEIIKSIVDKFQNPFYLDELRLFLVARGIENEQADAYVQRLLESQIILSELQPNVTGDTFFDRLISSVEEIGGMEEILGDLKEANRIISEEDWSPENGVKLQSLLSKYVNSGVKDLIQSDLFFHFRKNELPSHVFEDILKMIEHVAVVRKPYVSKALDGFINKFQTRYEDREIPLLIALDPEVGVGYGNNVSGEVEYMPLIEGVNPPRKTLERAFTLSEQEKRYFDKLYKAISNQEKVFMIDPTDSPNNEIENARLPRSMFLFGSLLASSQEDLDRGEFQFLVKSISGPSAGNLIGRFCYSSEELTSTVKKLLEDEQQYESDAVFAEIVHLPEARVGNVIMRPTLREYEIPILTGSTVKSEHVIPLDDLMVSVRNGNVVLRSKRLNKIVKPRLTSAHNYQKGLPYYRFLCDLQGHSYQSLDLWTWSHFEGSSYLPRIQFGKLILKRARWIMKKSELKQDRNSASKVDEKLFLAQLISEKSIPNKVVIVEGDNELLVDLSSELGLGILANILKKKDVLLKEFLYQPKNCFIKDSSGSYANELIVPLVSKSHIKEIQNGNPIVSSSQIKREFSVGEEWLYFKIYTGNKTADTILTEVLKPLVTEFLDKGLIEKWFFLRYNEHGEHLRVRFYHSQNSAFWPQVISEINERLKPYINQGLVYKIQLDTYQREIERYGVETMELSETLFFNDSQAILSFIDLIEGDIGEKYRWLFALLNVDMLLEDFGLSLYEKFQLISQLREYFLNETNKGKESKKIWISMNNQYRRYSKEIYSLLEKKTCVGEDIEEAMSCFVGRSDKNSIPLAVLKEKLSENMRGGVSLFAFISSHVHMTLNRTFLAKQRIHETVIYHFLAKFYDSKISRLQKMEKCKKESQIIGC
ncbi:lantibiotic dehydratase [Belliella marina]|uniref:Lantibiotic dehydratase n=1 Tax=Belliella marina TaxID=1644146 RepID=A0ABW4VFE2_9BACT